MYSGNLWAYKNGEHLPQSGDKETPYSFKPIVLEHKSGVLLLKQPLFNNVARKYTWLCRNK